MKNLQEHMQEELNESRINNKQIIDYISSWAYAPTDKKEMNEFLKSISEGIHNGIDERERYRKDDDEKEATEYLKQISEIIDKSLVK